MKIVTRARFEKNAFEVLTTDFVAAGRPSAHNYEALSKTHYNSVRISNFGLKFLQYIFNILYFRIKQKKIRFFQPKLPDYYLNNHSVMIEGNPILLNCSQGFTQNFDISQPS